MLPSRPERFDLLQRIADALMERRVRSEMAAFRRGWQGKQPLRTLGTSRRIIKACVTLAG